MMTREDGTQVHTGINRVAEIAYKDKPFSFAWDGCHKIYIMMDEAEHEKTIAFGYSDITRYDQLQGDEDEVSAQFLKAVVECFLRSCELRFIYALSSQPDGSTHFEQIITQQFN